MDHALRLLVALLVCQGCAELDTRPPTWSYLHPAIVEPSCATASCHGARTRAASLDLSDPDDAYAALIARRYVIPGDLTSTLLLHLRGEDAALMPPDGALPRGDRELIELWVADGAMP